MTPRPPRCDACYEQKPASDLKHCVGCETTWYCSKACQKKHWRDHIFDCDPKRPIATAYYLSRGCRTTLIPVHMQTRKDFGFEKAENLVGDDAQKMLLGLWTYVLRYLDVSEKELQKWLAEGTMVKRVKAAFEHVPHQGQGPYFAWFLEHQHILDRSPLDVTEPHEATMRAAMAATRKAWVMAGGSPDDSLETIAAKTEALTCRDQACLKFYQRSTLNVYPSPQEEQWVTFGYVAAMKQENEMSISQMYGELIFEHCTFNEFSTAYGTSSILKLAEEHRVSMAGMDDTTHVLFQDVMAESPRRFKTVWYLKQYVDRFLCAEPGAPPILPHRAMHADYGFINCRSASDLVMLDELYRAYFAHPGANPLELHNARVGGNL